MQRRMTLQNKVLNDSKLKLKYNILTKIGQGCFGQIYKAINRKTNEQVALKIEFTDQNRPKSNLSIQVSILNHLKGVAGVPKIYGAGKWEHGVFMEMELLGSSLQDQIAKDFSINQMHQLAIDIIQILKRIHEKGVVHQDLKPQNLMRNDKGNIVLIDFGLSLFALENTNSLKVRNVARKKGFIGTPRYASIAAHKGETQMPKDDIQSLLYVLGFLYQKKCPWLQLKGPTSEKMQKIEKYKTLLSEDWMQECSPPFSKVYKMVRQLAFEEEVNYVSLLTIFQKTRLTTVLKKKHINNQRRRMSDNRYECLQDVPKIYINFIQSNQPKQKSPQVSLISSEIVGSSEMPVQENNFSLIGQDNFGEFLQLLTDKILDASTEEQKEEPQNCKIEIYEDEKIKSFEHYESAIFKNPFIAS